MKIIFEELNQFTSDLALRQECLLTRKKNLKKINVQETWSSTTETTEWVSFPINVEVVICKEYQDGQTQEYPIFHIQNGKKEVLMDETWYIEDSTNEYFEELTNQYKAIIRSFKEKGFLEI